MSKRVVIDTNVLVSAALKRLGAEAELLDLVARSFLVCFASEPILAEYSDVLHRPRLRLHIETRAYLLEVIAAHAIVLEPVVRVFASPDESDNRFLECAETAEADFLITGNRRHFPRQWKSTAVVNAREFLTRLNR